MQDSSDSFDFCKSPLKVQQNTNDNMSEPYCVQNSMEQKGGMKMGAVEKHSSFTNLLHNDSTDSIKSSIIPESSDSEGEKKSFRKCLSLSRIKPNKILSTGDKEQQASLPKTSCSTEYNSDYILPSDKTMLDKENVKKFTDVAPKSIENEHLWTPKKCVDKQQQRNIISDSDTDSPCSKYSNKGSPRKKNIESPRKEYVASRKELVGPDIKLNLKDLGLNKRLSPWIQFIQKKSVMSAIPVSFLLL